jgi:hypothetical protein
MCQHKGRDVNNHNQSVRPVERFVLRLEAGRGVMFFFSLSPCVDDKFLAMRQTNWLSAAAIAL